MGDLLQGILLRRFVATAADRALGWLGARQRDFRIAATGGESVPWQVKPAAELVMLLIVLKRHGVRSHTLNALRDFALAEVEGFDWHGLASFEPSAATPLASVAEFCALEKRPPPFETDYFDLLRGIGFFEGMDRFPYREMDIAYAYSRIGIPGQEAKLATWFTSTAVGRGQILARYTLDDLYSLTHAIFYITDMGRRDPGAVLDAETAARLKRTLVALTAMMMRADNVDLLGELLLCWLFAGLVPTVRERAVFRAGMERVLATVTPEGAVAPREAVKRRADDGEATFAELYHTTLVGAMLFSLAARRRI